MATNLHCPACNAATTRAGSPFVSEWAVASHVAGCIHVNDRLHKSWARRHAPAVDLKQTVPRLAEALLWGIHEAIASSRSQNAKTNETPVATIHRFERKLHEYVKVRLQQHFGSKGEAWWVEGVPLQIRQDCAQRREADPERHELYQYTYLISLKSIMEKSWTIFEKDQSRLRSSVPELQKKQFLELLTRVNDVRNRHAHPVRAPETDSEQYTKDLHLARTLELVIDVLMGPAAPESDINV